MRIKCWYEHEQRLPEGWRCLSSGLPRTELVLRYNCSAALWLTLSARRRKWLERRAWLRYCKETRKALQQLQRELMGRQRQADTEFDLSVSVTPQQFDVEVERSGAGGQFTIILGRGYGLAKGAREHSP